jgi:uncharacterized protein YjbI with pentapeptide repeats
MSDNQGQPISKPVPVWNKSIEVDHKDFIKALGKGVADLCFCKWDSLVGDGVEAATALGLSAKSSEIGWWLVYRSLLQAMKELVDDKTQLPPEKFKPKELKAALNLALENSSLLIDNEFFNHPDKVSVVKLIQPAFRDWLISSGVTTVNAQVISEQFPRYFAHAVQTEWFNHPRDYVVLKENLDTPFTKFNERAQAWLRYSIWLQKQVEESMFLEAFSLRQVFVPLRAYYERKKSEDSTEPMLGSEEKRREEDQKTELVVVDLEPELFAWLSQPKRDDAIRLISGGPGSGKSSLTKMFAAKLAEQGTIPTLFIPLHHFEPLDDLIDAVGKFVKLDGIFTFNPLDSEHRGDRLLIIFDGLDELAMQGKIGAKTAQDFLGEVLRKVERLNQQAVCVQVLIGGRELVVQANKFAFRKERQILHILPYLVSPADRKQYVDPKQLLVEDQRQRWWECYGRASGSGFIGLPTQLNDGNLNDGNLNEITAQPLLNYLVALSFCRGEVHFSEATNLNAVYDDLLKSVYKRGWESNQYKPLQGIEEKEFGRFLEEIALASWHGSGRTTTVKDIESHCSHSGLEGLLNKFQKNFDGSTPQAIFTRLLTAFYFRRTDSDNTEEGTFEFTHKSFGEYLIAKRIVREVRSIQKQLTARKSDSDEGWDEREALRRWGVLCGSTTMDEYLFKFILNEVRLQYQSDAAEVARWQRTFCSLIEFMLDKGMPIERLNSKLNYQEEFRQSLNAEDSLLAVLGAFQSLTQEISNIKYPSPEAFGILLARLRGQRTSESNPMSFHVLTYLDLSDCNLIARDLIRADLRKANLSGANLIAANLIAAKLSGANLSGADLREANLREAHLIRANLIRANLKEANLKEANLSGANLAQVNLREANLRKANLRKANLAQANLSTTNLAEANLSEANLSGANLAEANLSEANLSGANLSGANLSGADLGKADLIEANLSGANLSGADLGGANLSGATNLTRTQLNSVYSIDNAQLPDYLN